MVKTTVYLPDADMQVLKAAARRRHQSEAELIREGIRRVLADEAGPVTPDFGLLDAVPITAADIDATLAAGLAPGRRARAEDDLSGERSTVQESQDL